MPVPLSVTNPKAKGLAAQVAAELPTEGPFARLQAVQQHATATATPGERSGADGAAAQQQPHVQQQQQQQPAEEVAIETRNLSFSYPDIGALLRRACDGAMAVFELPHSCCHRHAGFSGPLLLALGPSLCHCPAPLAHWDPHAAPSPFCPQTAGRCRTGRRWCRT